MLTVTSASHTLPRTRRRLLPAAAVTFLLLTISSVVGARVWLHVAMRNALPQVSGRLRVQGLIAPVQVARDEHGVPHITAANMDDLIFAQGFVTAQDRLWQMDMLRRHVSGRLAEVLGSSMIEHDRTQRYLQLQETAVRVLPQLSSDERHQLDRYAQGVNAEIATSRGHLPAEFRVLGYQPEPWSAADSILVCFALVEDLSTSYPGKLNREAVEARLPSDLTGDLYPVGSDRDHPPLQSNSRPAKPGKLPALQEGESQAALRDPGHLEDLLRAREILAASVSELQCEACRAGSNNWAVSGAHTQSGKPLVANDPHLSLTVPGIWYAAQLETGAFHVTGATVPGVPFVVIGRNTHIAWGFTNSTADVQDLYVEQIAGDQFQGPDGNLRPLRHQHETILVKHGSSVQFDVLLTEHGGVPTPVLSPLYPHEQRNIALRWSIYDPSATHIPLLKVNSAASGAALVKAFQEYGAPAQNLVWGDDQGHIGYHLIGDIPLRGPGGESGLTPVPVNSGTYEWAGYIPYDKLPAVTDPETGVLATANARVTGDSYPYPISLDWGPPYRNQRIWQLLSHGKSLTTADMLALQNDTYSALDKTYAERIAYAVDHARAPSKRLREAANLLRAWDGHVTADSVAPNITSATRRSLQPMLLQPHLRDAWGAYHWGESSYVFERMLQHEPARWLPAAYGDWNELLASALELGMQQAGAPADLKQWTWGSTHRIDLEHPLFGSSPWLRLLDGVHGTGGQPMEGNEFTIRVFNGRLGASMRFVADLADPATADLCLPMGESGNPLSQWFADQWSAWYRGEPVALSFGAHGPVASTLVLTP